MTPDAALLLRAYIWAFAPKLFFFSFELSERGDTTGKPAARSSMSNDAFARLR
jgi:hypothetical protein